MNHPSYYPAPENTHTFWIHDDVIAILEARDDVPRRDVIDLLEMMDRHSGDYLDSLVVTGVVIVLDTNVPSTT